MASEDIPAGADCTRRRRRRASTPGGVWSAACLALAAVVFVNLRRIESPERYLALVLGPAMLYMGAEQPIMLVIVVVAVGVLAGAGVMIWQVQYGRARLELDAPARRGDAMRGVITTSGFGWTVAGHDLDATVELSAIRTYRGGGQSSSVVVARSSATTSAARNGNDMTVRFTATIPVIDTSEGRFSWNVQLETRSPEDRATVLIDVA